ncbi:MAG: hypothetical protein IPJ37_05075 [Bacteroidales bacterium]|nr:hypothetical protein [Bacteroidales bacterium]
MLYKKVYAAGPGSTLSISNKYGDVSYIVNNDDSISVCATVTIMQDNRELARKSLSLITVRIDKILDTVSVSTNFDRKFFSDTYRKGRKSFSVDILVKAPSSVNADVTNEFGNISFEELTGKINVRLSYGLLSAARLTRGNSSPINSITVDNGKVNINSVNWLSANIRNCSSVEIAKAQAVLIKSDFSKISIGEVNSMVADSKSDIYTIGNVKI